MNAFCHVFRIFYPKNISKQPDIVPSFLPLLNRTVGPAVANLMFVVLANVEDIGVGLRQPTSHHVDVLHVGLALQLLVAPRELQNRDGTGYHGLSSSQQGKKLYL